jgi:serine/threonine protein kinase
MPKAEEARAEKIERNRVISLQYDEFQSHGGADFSSYLACIVKDDAEKNNFHYNPTSLRFHDNEGTLFFRVPGPELWPITVEYQYVEHSIATESGLEESKCMSQYDIVEVLGEGAFGKVIKARCKQSGELRALKEIKPSSREEGVPSTTIREVAILKAVVHENIVRLHDLFSKPGGSLVLVFEVLDSDLKQYMRSLGGQMNPSQVCDFVFQLLKGVEFCHANRIIHRDLKPQNLLINRGKHLKIADFGLARAFSLPVPEYTHEVITLWYRPLEILLGSRLYSIPVDMWGVGCIFAEMATGTPLFAGDSEIDTVFKIMQKLGTPTVASWPGLSALPDFKPTFPKWRPKGWKNIRNTQAQIGLAGVDLLDQLTCYNPCERISARRALQHGYFA